MRAPTPRNLPSRFHKLGDVDVRHLQLCARAISAPPSDISGNSTQNAAILDQHQIVLAASFRAGTDMDKSIESQLQLHLRAQAGTRIERTEQIALQTLDAIKREVGPDNVAISLGFVGTQPPNYPINTIYLWSSGSEEGVLQVQLKRGAGIGIEDLKERLRQKLPQELEGVRFSFEPSDIVSRVMSFGAPTPIEVAVSGPSLADSRQYAEKLRANLAKVPTLRDLGFEQELEYPTVKGAAK